MRFRAAGYRPVMTQIPSETPHETPHEIPHETRDESRDGGSWPRCEECGTELQQVQVDFVDADFSEGRTGVPVTQDICPNPDCTRHDRDLAAAAGDPEPEVRDLPGSLGGDHGGG